MTPFIGQGGTEGFHSSCIFQLPQGLGNLGTQLAFFPFLPIEIKVQVSPVLVIHHLRCWRMHHFSFRSEEYRDERLDRPLVAKKTQGFSSCEPDLSFSLPCEIKLKGHLDWSTSLAARIRALLSSLSSR